MHVRMFMSFCTRILVESKHDLARNWGGFHVVHVSKTTHVKIFTPTYTQQKAFVQKHRRVYAHGRCDANIHIPKEIPQTDTYMPRTNIYAHTHTTCTHSHTQSLTYMFA
jgi:hypothetical protein